MIEITNAGSGPVRRYGHDFDPGTTKEYSPEELMAYSLMEISRELHALNRKIPVEQTHIYPPKQEGPVSIYFDHFDLEKMTTPWIVRQFHKYQDRRSLKKRQRKAKP